MWWYIVFVVIIAIKIMNHHYRHPKELSSVRF